MSWLDIAHLYWRQGLKEMHIKQTQTHTHTPTHTHTNKPTHPHIHRHTQTQIPYKKHAKTGCWNMDSASVFSRNSFIGVLSPPPSPPLPPPNPPPHWHTSNGRSSRTCCYVVFSVDLPSDWFDKGDQYLLIMYCVLLLQFGPSNISLLFSTWRERGCFTLMSADVLSECTVVWERAWIKD